MPKLNASLTGTTGTLTPSGDVTTTSNGQTIQNLDITGNITVNHTGVRVINCKVTAYNGGDPTSASSYDTFAIRNGGSGTLAEVTDCELKGSESDCIQSSLGSPTVSGNYIHETGGDGLKPGSGWTITGNFLEDIGRITGKHADGIQVQGASNVTITGNTFDMPWNDPTWINSQCIIVQDDTGAVDSVDIEQNWINGGGYSVQIREKGNYSGPSNCRLVGNVFGDDYENGYYVVDGSTGTVISGNTREATGQLIGGQTGQLVLTESGGAYSFPVDSNGYRIPDFSYAGYLYNDDSSTPAGNLPVYETDYAETGGRKATVASPSGTPSTNRTNIQNAINAIAALTPNSEGYRGAVILQSGNYQINSEVVISASGVVLKGAGGDSTTISAGFTSPGQLVRVNRSNSAQDADAFKEGRTGSQWDVTDAIVDVGDLTFNLEPGHDIEIGDEIIIEHPCTQAWITAVGNGGATDPNDYWEVDEVPIRYWRTVTNVATNAVTVDAPIMYSLVKSRSQCFVYKYTGSYLEKVGIEDLTVDHITSGTTDTNHCNDCVRFNGAKDGWVRNVRMQNYKRSGLLFGECRNMTVDSCEAIDPNGAIDSGQRYGFQLNSSQLALFTNCYGEKNRHAYITNGHAMDSGNVYHYCDSDDNYAGAFEHAHQRWGNGSLIDNCVIRHVGTPEAARPFFDNLALWAGNHGNNADGHGWASVTGVVYRCNVQSGMYACVHVPPTGMNYAIANTGQFVTSYQDHGDYPGAMDVITSGTLPQSLYEAQLAQRVGGEPASGSVLLSDASLDFGYATTSSTTNDRTLTLTAVGSASGTVSTSAPFSIVSGSPFNLTDGQTADIVIRYTPTTDAKHTDTATVSIGGSCALSGVGATLQAGLTFNADAGTLIAPMADNGTDISSPTRDAGYAVYAITIATGGTYRITASVDAPDDGTNSFFVEFDADPAGDGTKVWDITSFTTGFETRTVSKRGEGAFNDPEFPQAEWNLSAGTHYLVIQQREANTALASLTVALVTEAVAAPSATVGRVGVKYGLLGFLG